MENISQNLPSVLTSESVAATGITATEATAVGLPPLGKKRKPNANGPRRSSPAWDHFIKLPNEAVPTAACKHCHRRYLCDPKTHGTSNLLAHTKTCFKNPQNDPRQSALMFASGEGGALVAASQRFNAAACRKAIALFVILDEHAFRVVEGEGFKLLCKQLQPLLTIPSRRTVARDCFQLFVDEKLRLKEYFKSDCCRVALTTDCWTSVQNLSYMTLTAHFINNDWKYEKRILSFCLVPNHKGDTIGRKIEEILREWGIRNVSTITVDNASSNDVAVAYLKKRIRNMGGLMGDGSFFHLRCCAHILNLVVGDGLKQNELSISSVRNAVRFVRSSSQRGTRFKECIEFARISSRKLLCLDVQTRWNSAYLMLEAAEKFQTAFEKLEGEDSSYLDFFGEAGPPSVNDWENVRCFVSFLKIFYDATKEFSSSQEVSLHKSFHQLAAVHCELKRSAMNLNSILASMGYEMKQKYDKYWGKIENINKLLYFGVILDPRFKFSYVEWCFNDMYGDQPTFFVDLIAAIQTELFKLFNWYKDAHDQQHNSGQPLACPSEPSSVSENVAPIVVPSHLARAEAFKQHLKQKESVVKKNELERYLDEERADDDVSFDILVWWKQNSCRYPVLSTMVRDVLATPVSTVASESAFNTGGRVLDTYRSSLSPQMAEALICAQNWLKPTLSQFKDLNINEEYEFSDTVVSGI
jgi:hypothetical protein